MKAALIGLIFGAFIAFILVILVHGEAEATHCCNGAPDPEPCGGWWNPCCPWYDPDRCAAFDANKKRVAEQNVGYFQRWEDRLESLNRVIGLLPVGSFPGWVISQAKDAAKAAKDANAAAARGVTPAQAQAWINGETVDSGYEWVDQLGDDASWLYAQGYHTVELSSQFTACMQGGGEKGCDELKVNANWALWYLGDEHYQIAVTSDVVAWQLEYWYGGADADIAETALILREMANQSRNTGWEFQQ